MLAKVLTSHLWQDISSTNSILEPLVELSTDLPLVTPYIIEAVLLHHSIGIHNVLLK